MTASFDFSVQYQVTDSGVGEAKGKAKGGDGGWLMAFAEAMGKLMQKQVEKIQDFADSIGDKPTPSDSTKRSEEHTSELQSLMRISYAVFCLKKKKHKKKQRNP